MTPTEAYDALDAALGLMAVDGHLGAGLGFLSLDDLLAHDAWSQSPE